ncbi:MAG: PIN domain-containing protein [Blastochloris sp.]|nr:PIN domain-containing protein [Blastochloris sp.]
MMVFETIFWDTSGLLATLDQDDDFHLPAIRAWEHMMHGNYLFVTTDYIRLETWALVQRRLGSEAVETLYTTILPLCQIEITANDGFDRVVGQWLLTRQRSLSLVDVTSFDCMRRLGLTKVFTYDSHFTEQGFKAL